MRVCLFLLDKKSINLLTKWNNFKKWFIIELVGLFNRVDLHKSVIVNFIFFLKGEK